MSHVADSRKNRPFDPFSGPFRGVLPPSGPRIRARKRPPAFWHKGNVVGLSRLSFSTPLLSRHSPPRRVRRNQRGQAVQTLPLITACNQLPRPNGARSRRAAPLFSMSPNQAIPANKINPFLPTRRRPTVDHSLGAGDAQRQWVRACLPDGQKPQCLLWGGSGTSTEGTGHMYK